MKYFQSLIERDPEAKYIGILTDCLKYATFAPIVKDNKVTELRQIGSTRDISLMDPNEVLLWIGSFLFSKSGLSHSAVDLKIRFGPDSPTHALGLTELTALWKEVKDKAEANLKLKLWIKNTSIVYGNEPAVGAFMGHTYLVTLVKLLIYLP